MNTLKILSDYQETINKKKKILNNKLKVKPGSKKSLNLFDDTLNMETKSFKLRMIHTGIKIVPNESMKHTPSSKKLHDIKTRYI